MVNALFNLCWAESLKLRRSRAPLMSALAYAMAPVAAALMLLASRDPSRAWLCGTASPVLSGWPGYLDAVALASALGGLIVFGLFMIWIFGREHADRTAKELLTLPIPREMLAAGKILVAAIWCAALQAGMLILALLLGACLRLPMGSSQAFCAGIAKVACIGAMVFCLSVPFGLAANLSRGTMAAVGLLFLSLFFGLLMAALGWGACFPWSIPLLYAAAPESLSCCSGAFVGLIGLAGLLGSMAWWRRADQR